MNKKISLNSPYSCPQCGKEIVSKNNNAETNNGIVIKSKLTFIDEEGSIMCRCKNCKNVIALPLKITSLQK